MNYAEVAGVVSEEKLGIWQVLLKVNLTVVPVALGLVVTWGIWQTSKTFEFDSFVNSGERFSQSDARDMEDEIQQRNETLLRGLESKTDANTTRLNSLDRDTTRILTILERLEDRDK